MQMTVCTSYSYNVEVSFIVGLTSFADTKDVSAFGSFLCFIHYTMEDVIFFPILRCHNYDLDIDLR